MARPTFNLSSLLFLHTSPPPSLFSHHFILAPSPLTHSLSVSLSLSLHQPISPGATLPTPPPFIRDSRSISLVLRPPFDPIAAFSSPHPQLKHSNDNPPSLLHRLDSTQPATPSFFALRALSQHPPSVSSASLSRRLLFPHDIFQSCVRCRAGPDTRIILPPSPICGKGQDPYLLPHALLRFPTLAVAPQNEWADGLEGPPNLGHALDEHGQHHRRPLCAGHRLDLCGMWDPPPCSPLPDSAAFAILRGI